MEQSKRLSNLQIELLQLFKFELDDAQLREVRALLAAYFAEQATKAVDALFEANGWGDDKINEWSGEHLRTKYEGE